LFVPEKVTVDRSIDGSGEAPIRVLLADDHTMFREGLAEILASRGGMEVVGQTGGGEEAVALAKKVKPDVVITQVQRPFKRAKENLIRIFEISPKPKVIICTILENPRHVPELMGLGVSAYLIKSSSTAELIATIRIAILDPKGRNVVVGMPRAMLEKAQGDSGGVLTVRELEILLLAARGLSNRQIASSLGLQPSTVERHLANIYSKMEVGARGEAVKKALQEEWITVEEITEDEEEPSPR
jgi:DNA-binding NarL/FixJ family response regulator